MFSDFVKDFSGSARRAKNLIGDERYKMIVASIEKTNNKASAEEQKGLEEGFAKSVKQELIKYKPELVSGYEQTAAMGGRVLLRVLTKKNGFEVVIDCELRARRIPFDDEEFIQQNGEDANLDEIPISSKKAFLKTHESRRLMRKNVSLSEEEAKKMTNSIEPFSDEMKEVLFRQNALM